MKKNFPNLIINIIWGILVILILIVFFRDRLPNFTEIIKRLKREPQKLTSVFKARDMTEFECLFNNSNDLDIWKTNNCRLQIVSAPFGSDDRWAKVTYFPTGSPSLLLTDETIGMMDWRRADAFSFKAYNPQSWPVSLKLKIKDASGQKHQKDIVLSSKQKTGIKITVQDLAHQLDVSRISYLNLFLWEPSTETIIYYNDFTFQSPVNSLPSTGLVKFMGLNFPTTVKAGQIVEGSFYFLLNKKLSGNNLLILRLRQKEKIYPMEQIAPPFPTEKWRIKQLQKIGPVPITIPAKIPPGVYQLEVALAQPIQTAEETEYVFQPYDNPEIPGYNIMEIIVEK